MSTGNPLAPLVPALADGRRAAAKPPPLHRWAWVASTTPLRIRFAAETDPLDADVTSLVPASTLRPGDQVLTLHHAGETIILGAATRPTSAWTPLTPAAPWTLYPNFGDPQVRRIGDRVELQGMIRGGTGGPDEPLTILPAWARPPVTRPLICNHAGTAAAARALADGVLRLDVAGSAGGWVSLNGLVFHI